MPTIEEVHSDHEDVANVDAGSDNDVPGLDKIQSRAERKARKALLGLGLKKVPGITRVTLRRPKGLLFVVSTPEVFKTHSGDCYIVFGEAKGEDPNALAHAAAAQQLATNEHKHNHSHDHHAHTSEEKDDEPPALEEIEEAGEVDETGVEPKDIELVMSQVNCSRAKAVKVLKENGGDLITAIMAATE